MVARYDIIIHLGKQETPHGLLLLRGGRFTYALFDTREDHIGCLAQGHQGCRDTLKGSRWIDILEHDGLSNRGACEGIHLSRRAKLDVGSVENDADD